MNTDTFSIYFHNYYGDHDNWVRFFSEKIRHPFMLFYNIVEDSLYNLEEDEHLLDRLRQAASGSCLQKIFLRRSSNQGKDIGGKLVLLDACLREDVKSIYSIFLHDKKSPYKVQGPEWKDKLFHIIDPGFIQRTLTLFNEKKEVGIIAGLHSINNEYDHSLSSFSSNNRSQLLRLRSEFDVNNTDYRYVAGTMFWVRSLPLLNFFRKYPPLEVRKTLEKGNIMDDIHGTNTHAWERMLSWLIFAQGYTIKGFL